MTEPKYDNTDYRSVFRLRQGHGGKALEGIEHDERSGLRPEYLAGKISAIIRKKTPARRYVIASPLQKLSVFAKRILPAPLFEKILSLYYGV